MNSNVAIMITVAVVLAGGFFVNVGPTIMGASSLAAMAFLVIAIGRFFTQRAGAPALAPAVYNRDEQV
jgi:hypothetical protein